MEKYLVVDIDFVDQMASFPLVQKMAFIEYTCLGIEEFSLQEKEIDKLLGKEAVGGGEIALSIIEKVERAVSTSAQCYKFFFADEKGALFAQQVREQFPSLKVVVNEFKVEDWDKNWRVNFKPISVSNRIEIVPAWEKKENEDARAVYIYPGMGFGTGNHETTFLCLQAIDFLFDHIKKQGKFLDFGCGSGILGIAATKLFKGVVDFCDIDRDALDNCLQNLIINFQDKENLGHALILRDRFFLQKEYNLIFANILEEILIKENQLLKKGLAKGGYLIISGILLPQVEQMKETFKELKLVNEFQKGEWSAIIFQRGE